MKGAGRWLAARSSFQEDLIVGIQDKVLTLRVCWCNPSSKRSLGSTLSSSTLTQLSTVSSQDKLRVIAATAMRMRASR